MIHSTEGSAPLIISFPHVGTVIPADIAAGMTVRARAVEDTDWHVEKLYEFARARQVSWLEPTMSRYVVDLNRPPDDAALYPGQVSTGLCPAATFDGEPLYAVAPPDGHEVNRRRELYWQPYHTRLRQLLDAAIAHHGYAVLLDAHSIASEVPRLFDGRLPDLNVGTNDGRSCGSGLGESVYAAACSGPFTAVLNGRFKGGFITRHYGQSAGPVHAVQLEIGQLTYLERGSVEWSDARAAPLVGVLASIVEVLLSWRPEL
jgi:N-formylglutamate deformylase